MSTLCLTTVRGGSISFWSYLERKTQAHLGLLQHRFPSLSQIALLAAQAGRAGCALLLAGGHTWTRWGAPGAVNPSSGVVATARLGERRSSCNVFSPGSCVQSVSQKPVLSFCRDSGKHCCLSVGKEILHYPCSLTGVTLK